MLNGAACWVPLGASHPCLWHFGPCAVSRGLNSNQVRFKNPKTPNVHHKDLSSREYYTAEMQNSLSESWAILLGSLTHAAKQIFVGISSKEFTSTQLNSLRVKFRATDLSERGRKRNESLHKISLKCLAIILFFSSRGNSVGEFCQDGKPVLSYNRL